MKTPEQMAETFAQTSDACCGTSDILIAAENAFLAGYKAGIQEAETRILNEFFDNYGASEHAKFACKVNAYEWDTDEKK